MNKKNTRTFHFPLRWPKLFATFTHSNTSKFLQMSFMSPADICRKVFACFTESTNFLDQHHFVFLWLWCCSCRLRANLLRLNSTPIELLAVDTTRWLCNCRLSTRIARRLVPCKNSRKTIDIHCDIQLCTKRLGRGRFVSGLDEGRPIRNSMRPKFHSCFQMALTSCLSWDHGGSQTLWWSISCNAGVWKGKTSQPGHS